MITDEQARAIGKAIRDEAQLIRVPIENEMERRAICLKLAIETRGPAFRTDSLTEDADGVLAVARMYDAFVSAAEAVE